MVPVKMGKTVVGRITTFNTSSGLPLAMDKLQGPRGIKMKIVSVCQKLELEMIFGVNN
jgi:hypothetical protein